MNHHQSFDVRSFVCGTAVQRGEREYEHGDDEEHATNEPDLGTDTEHASVSRVIGTF